MDIKEVRREDVDSIQLSRYTVVSYGHDNEPLDSIKD